MKNLKLKFARMEKGLSQIELAEKVGVTRQTIGMMEAGDYNPSLKLCTAICRELGKTLNDLVCEDVCSQYQLLPYTERKQPDHKNFPFRISGGES